MRILITGKEGQVARSLQKRLPGDDLIFAHRPIFDLADADSIERVVDAAEPDLILSVAAFTAVDRAEDEPDMAMRINALGPGILARSAARHAIPIIHLSTDYVFDGSGERPWREDDPVAPLGVYGATKLAGERAIANAGAQHVVMRTAWVFSPFASNFVKTMLRLAETQKSVSVVEDQFGNPTSALDLADAISAMIRLSTRKGSTPPLGLYHVAGTGSTDWATFARTIFAFSAARGGPVAEVVGIASGDFPTRARRPANSRLDCGRFEDAFDFRMPEWQSSLAATIAQLIPRE